MNYFLSNLNEIHVQFLSNNMIKGSAHGFNKET